MAVCCILEQESVGRLLDASGGRHDCARVGNSGRQTLSLVSLACWCGDGIEAWSYHLIPGEIRSEDRHRFPSLATAKNTKINKPPLQPMRHAHSESHSHHTTFLCFELSFSCPQLLLRLSLFDIHISRYHLCDGGPGSALHLRSAHWPRIRHISILRLQPTSCDAGPLCGLR